MLLGLLDFAAAAGLAMPIDSINVWDLRLYLGRSLVHGKLKSVQWLHGSDLLHRIFFKKQPSH